MTREEWAVGAQLLAVLKAKHAAYRDSRIGSPDSGAKLIEANALWTNWLSLNGEALLAAATASLECPRCYESFGVGPALYCPECGWTQ